MNKRYGEWIVIGPSPFKKHYSRCRCSCGVVRDVSNSNLRRGKSKSCGHVSIMKKRQKSYQETDKKVLGETFGRLTPIKRISETGKACYLCQCSCGNKANAFGTELLNGHIKSCGCFRKDNSKESMESIHKKGIEVLSEGFIDGTARHSLKQKLSKNNKTGFKGISKLKNGKYRVYINLKRKQKHLGVFDNLEDAKQARLKAEKELYDPYLNN